MRKSALLWVGMLSGCLVVTSETAPAGPQPALQNESLAPVAPAIREATLAPQCAAEGTACSADADCCGAAYCTNHFTYLPPVCEPKLADGSFCFDEVQCLTGACTSGRCGTVACSAAVGEECELDADCCGGFCFNYTYAPPVCRAPLPGGASCYDDLHCASGSCQLGSCAP